MATNGALLSLKGVSKKFGPVQALDGVDFEVQPGEVVALVGDNGAGKSTLVKVISGIHSADEGTIIFEGEEVTLSSPHQATQLGIATHLTGNTLLIVLGGAALAAGLAFGLGGRELAASTLQRLFGNRAERSAPAAEDQQRSQEDWHSASRETV